MDNTFLNKAWYYSTFLVVIFPLIGIKFTSIAIMIVGLLSLIIMIKNHQNIPFKKHLKWLLLFTSIYIVYLISSVFHPFNHDASFVLEKKMSLLLFPLIFLLTPTTITKKHLQQLLLTFSLSVLAITLFTNIYILFTGIPEEYLLVHDASYSYRTYFEDISRIHPTYLSLYLGFSALVLFNFFINKRNNKAAYLIAFALCSIGLIPLAAKMPILAYIISLAFYLIFSQEIVLKKKIIFVSTLFCLLALSFTIPSLRIRIDEVLKSSLAAPQGENFNSVNIRVGINNCSLKLIKNNWSLGIGAGQLQSELDNCYANYETTAFSKIRYNTHNEYFNILLGIGIIGLGSFLLLLMTLLYQSYKTKNALFFVLLILLILCFSTENLLDRQGGVVFFTLFTTLFVRVYFLESKQIL